MSLRPTVTALPSYEPFLLGGEPVALGERAARAVIDPATGEVLTTVADATTEDVDAAVAIAVAAHADRRWRGLAPLERARILNRAAELIEENLEELAVLETRDNGKPIERSRADTAMGGAHVPALRRRSLSSGRHGRPGRRRRASRLHGAGTRRAGRRHPALELPDHDRGLQARPRARRGMPGRRQAGRGHPAHPPAPRPHPP
jgi:hypothetical protein